MARGLLENFIVVQLVKKFPASMGHKGALRYSKKLTINHILSQLNPIDILALDFSKVHFNIIVVLTSDLSCGLFC
jgi:hypothetical protein